MIRISHLHTILLSQPREDYHSVTACRNRSDGPCLSCHIAGPANLSLSLLLCLSQERLGGIATFGLSSFPHGRPGCRYFSARQQTGFDTVTRWGLINPPRGNITSRRARKVRNTVFCYFILHPGFAKAWKIT